MYSFRRSAPSAFILTVVYECGDIYSRCLSELECRRISIVVNEEESVVNGKRRAVILNIGENTDGNYHKDYH